MGDQKPSVAGPHPNQALQMPDYGSSNMAASSQSQMSMSMAPSCMPGLPALAPAPPPTLAPAPAHPHPPQPHQQQQQGIQTSQMQQLHPGSATPQPSIAGQPMTQQQQIMGQPQFVIQQHFPGQQPQYATFPQFAYANPQGQLVLQPAPFSLQGGPSQPGQQQVILTNVPQKPGAQPQLISTSQGNQGKPGQPAYTITSSGQLQMPGPQQPQQTFMMVGSGLPGTVTMPGPAAAGQTQTIHTTSMAGIKGSDGKPVPVPPQLTGPSNPQQQQYVIPPPGMTYMQAGPHQLIPNGQLIFRGPVPPDQQQQVMFSPSAAAAGQPQPPPQPQVQHTNNLQNPNNPLGGMQIPGPRPPVPVGGPPPGKTAISRAIAPLPPSVSQTNARVGYMASQQQTGQPSPKSKQKMSPRGASNGLGRPPAPKGGNMKMAPRMASMTGPGVSSPGSPMMPGSPRPPTVPLQPQSMSSMTSIAAAAGPPTLSPMANESLGMPSLSLPSTPTTTAPMVSMSQMPVPVQPTQLTAPLPVKPVGDRPLDPPTLTKEVITSMPNLGQPNLNHKAMTSLPNKPGGFVNQDAEQGLVPTPKAVVKPQVVKTHVIDGHVIKESSQPFPVSPVKATARRKSEKADEKPVNGSGPVKRGPGRPPGSTKSAGDGVKAAAAEPPEKKLKLKETTTPSTPASPAPPMPAAPATPQAPQPPPTSAPATAAPPTILSTLRGNPLKWNVTEVCDFIKNLPGCGEYVEDFAQQEIDGQALMLLKADHLMSAMSIKLGPALKICSHIEQIREELNKL